MFFWSPGMTLASIEKAAVLQALAFYHGNKTTAANALGCSQRTIYDKLEQYAVEEKAQKDKEESLRKRDEEFSRRERWAPSAEAQGLAPRSGPAIDATSAGPRVESVEAPTGQSLPLPQRSELSPVLPEPVARGSSSGPRKRI